MIPKPDDIIDRDGEWRALVDLWLRDRPELAFVVGRRRVGKSFVLARFARAVGGLYYQATRRTEVEQLAGLSKAIGDHFQDAALQHGIPFPNWEELLAYLAHRAGQRNAEAAPQKPLLVVLDEFPYLVDAAPALPSIIQETWDHRWTGSRIKLVLSGSYVTAMERLEAADQPLYGRRTAKLVFAPFTYRDVGAFVPDYAAQDRLRAYGLFGHLPGHLALLDPAAPLAANAAALLLDPHGRLVDDAQHMLDAFLGEGGVHYSILEAIASGEQTWSGITKRVGRSGGSLLRPLEWLEGMGLTERVAPITEKDPAKSKRTIYRITDPYISFWHRAVAPLVRTGSVGLVPPEVLWAEEVEPRLDDHMGRVFEAACREFVRHASGVPPGAGGHRALPFRPLRVGEWWDAGSSEQVDIVALGSGGAMLAAECKWGPVTERHLDLLRDRARRVASEFGGVRRTHLALFTGRSGFDPGLAKAAEAEGVLILTAEDLVENPFA